MTDMLWIVPSRSRPDNIANLISAWHTTRCNSDLMVVVDDDDPELDGYMRVKLNFAGFPWVGWGVTERKRLGGTLNHYATLMAPQYDVIGFMGDDHRPKTPIWDGLMAAQLRKMKTGMVYGNDLLQGKHLPTEIAMTTDIISALGYMVPPTLTHLYLDNFWLELGRGAGCIEYMEHVIIEHLHPHAGKAQMDAQYEELNSQKQHDRDGHAFETYKRKGLADDVAKVKGLL